MSRFLTCSLCTIIALGTFLASCARKMEPPPPRTEAVATPPVKIPPFDGNRALLLIERQVAFGPRVAGTPAHDSCRMMLVRELQGLAEKVVEQPFTETGYDGAKMRMTNIIATIGSSKQQRITLCAHWDSRPRADQERDPAQQSKAIPGANDGASGVAVLLVIARSLKDNLPPVGVDIVLLDGEDYGKSSDLDRYCLGARYFATHLPPGFTSQAAILLDMVGDQNAVFNQEANSVYWARDIVNDVWAAARRANAYMFNDAPGGQVFDDHVPLNNAGIRTIDIIDADLIGNRSPDPNRRYWHTLGDTPDKCSASTLQAVGSTLLQYLFTEQPPR